MRLDIDNMTDIPYTLQRARRCPPPPKNWLRLKLCVAMQHDNGFVPAWWNFLLMLLLWWNCPGGGDVRQGWISHSIHVFVCDRMPVADCGKVIGCTAPHRRNAPPPPPTASTHDATLCRRASRLSDCRWWHGDDELTCSVCVGTARIVCGARSM